MSFFLWLQPTKENDTLEYIEKYIEQETLNENPPLHRITKYGEHVVINYVYEEFDFITIWMTIFKKGNIADKFPMYLFFEKDELTLKILEIQVLGKNRSKGYGTIFMDEVFNFIESNNVEKLTGLAQRPNDPQLINFYKNYGIEIRGNDLYWESPNK